MGWLEGHEGVGEGGMTYQLVGFDSRDNIKMNGFLPANSIYG